MRRDEFLAYVHRNLKLVALIAVVSSMNMPAFEILTSNTFHDVTRAPLSVKQVNEVRVFSLISVMVENLPQMIILGYVHFTLGLDWKGAVAIICGVIDVVYMLLTGVIAAFASGAPD